MKAVASPGRRPMRAASALRRIWPAVASARRHGRGDAAEYPGDERTALCGADGGRGAQRAQHPARCALDRIPARSWRRKNHPGRSRIFRRDRGGADADEGPEAIRDRRR